MKRKLTVAIHQPNYLPYLGYFDKVRRADVFVILDDCQFSKNSFTNRNRIKSHFGQTWITVPVQGRSNKIPINEVKISNTFNWTTKHLNSLRECYKDAEHVDLVLAGLSMIYKKNWSLLSNLNKSLIHYCLTLLGINIKVISSSTLNIETTGTQRLVDICKAVGGTYYLAGQSGHRYMDMELFKKEEIKIKIHKFTHPVYKQQYGNFVPNMSVVDYLMNEWMEPFWEEC
jgi:hypothetical protein